MTDIERPFIFAEQGISRAKMEQIRAEAPASTSGAADVDLATVGERINEVKLAVACAVAEEDFELVAQLGAELRRLRQLNGEA